MMEIICPFFLSALGSDDGNLLHVYLTIARF